MRKVIVIALICTSLAGFAQSNKEDIDILQSVFGKEKKELVKSFVKLDAASTDAFWKLYDEYETSRKQLGVKRIELLERYAKNYATLDDPTTDKIVQDMASLASQNEKLIFQYYGKMKKASGVKPAAQFYQLENYLLTVVRATILENIPFIGELDDKW